MSLSNSIKYFYVIIFIIFKFATVYCADPVDSLSCPFDTSHQFCGWNANNLITTDKWIFRNRTPQQPPEPGPLDAVTGLGQFIQFIPSNTEQIKPKQLYSEFASPNQNANKNPICFTFYYYIFGSDVGTLSVAITHLDNSSNKVQEVYWSKSGSMADKWYKQKLTIQPQNTTFTINFQIYSSSESNIGAIALDNFVSSPDSCKFDATEQVVCDFETDGCGWKTNKTLNKEQLIWFINYGAIRTKAMPLNDHTFSTSYGHYLTNNEIPFIASTELPNRRVAEFTSPYYNGTVCLKFWYYKQAQATNILEVATVDLKGRAGDVLWEAPFSEPTNGWRFTQITITKKNPYSLVIRADKVNTDNTEVAIDDISVVTGSCRVVSCDFNVDLCGFTNTDWKQGFGRVFNYSLIPTKLPKDRTLDIGMFMYTDFTYKSKNTTKKDAILVSEILPKMSTFCLRFWYYKFGKQISLQVMTKVRNKNDDKTLWSLETSKGITYENWTQVEIEVKQQISNFQFYFIASNNGISKDFLAIDDIQLSAELCKPLPATTPKPTPNPLASDVTCSFSSSFCDWKTYSDNTTNDWFRLSDPYRHKYGLPKYDPSGNNKAKYIYLYNDQLNGSLINAKLHTVEKSTQSPACLSFWFYMRTDGNAMFTLARFEFKDPMIFSKYLVSKSGSFGEKWHFIQLNVHEDELGNDYHIYINASIESGVIAFSQLQLHRKTCEARNANILLNNFEDGLQDFKISGPFSEDVKIYAGKDLKTKIVDHTLDAVDGHFYGYNCDKQYCDGTQSLYAPQVDGRDSCVTFWYYIRGNQSLEIQVKRPVHNPWDKGDIYYKVSGDQGPFWHVVRLDIDPDEQNWGLVFEMKGKNSPKGVIGIDDVQIELGKQCPADRRCDFEIDDCLWESVTPIWSQSQSLNETELKDIKKLLTTQFVWNRHSGIHDGNRLWPLRDHTTKTPEGSYLVLNADPPRKNGDRAVLMSQRYSLPQNTTDLCFSMAYILKPGAIVELYKSENFSSYKQLLTNNMLNVNKQDWDVIKVNIKRENFNSDNIWLYLVGTVGQNQSTFAAIDDIAVDYNKCFVDDISFNCKEDGSEKIPKTKVCDFRMDCSNGRDEENCGSCPFTTSTCGYQLIDRYELSASFKWHSINASNGYIYAKQDSQFDPKAVIKLVSPLINYASSLCRMTFQYHFGGNQLLGHLSVYIQLNNQEEFELWDSRAQVVKSVNSYFSISTSTIGRIRTPFKIQFRAYSTGNTADYIAIKNAKLLYCESLSPSFECDVSNNKNFKCLNNACIDRSLVCDHTDDCGDGSDEYHCETYPLRCNFEDGFCGWTNTKMSETVNSQWKLQSGTQDLLLGPTRDHSKGISSGKYLIMRYENVKQIGNYMTLYSRLEGPVFKPNTSCQMRFHYDLEGNGFLSLSINTINNKSKTYREVWITDKVSNAFEFSRGELKFNEVMAFQVIILGTIRVKVNGSSLIQPYIVLDDISFTPECNTINDTINTQTTNYLTTTIGYNSTIDSKPTDVKPKRENLALILGITFGVLIIIAIIGTFVYLKFFKSPKKSSDNLSMNRMVSIDLNK